MKKFFYLFILSSILGCTSNASNKIKQENIIISEKRAEQTDQLAVLSFDKIEHDFGTINEGDIVETAFVFTNTGNSDLIIQDARGSCGCTVPEYPKNIPIAPGDSSVMKVKFDSSNKPNNQMKTVTISANTKKGREVIRIKTFVTPDPVKEQQRQDRRQAMKDRQKTNQ